MLSFESKLFSIIKVSDITNKILICNLQDIFYLSFINVYIYICIYT